MNRKLLILPLYLLTLLGYCQGDTSRFCNPKLEGMARSKGFNIQYERVFNSSIESNSTDTSIGNNSGNIETNNKFDILIRLPIWNKPGLKVVWGLRYYFEEFNFKSPENINYDLYRNLHDKNLQSLGTNFNILKPIDKESYIGARILVELNGDYTVDELPTSSFLRYSFAGIYGRKPCPTKTWGLGIYYSYTFGRRSIYPVFAYSNTYSRKWGVEGLLPANFKVRRNFSEKTLTYFGYEIEGASYHLQFVNPPLGSIRDLELRRSNIRFSLDFEREIHDWLWFGISTGVRVPIGFNLAERLERTALIKNKVSPAPFINFNIFIVPPRSLENKIINAK